MADGVPGSDGRVGRRLLGDHVFVFVGGLHGSGTSMLAAALARHPDVSGLTGTDVTEDEDQRLQDVLPPAARYGGAGRFALDPGAHLTETSPLATCPNAERMIVSLAPYWDLARPVLVDASPATVVRTRLLQAMVPGARFVLVVRHPVVVSLATRSWRRGTPFAGLLDHWFAAHETLLGDLPHLSAARVVKYEHLVRDPGAVLADVAADLHLTGVPTDSVRGDDSAGYLDEWDRWSRSRVPWRRAEHHRLLERYEERANGFGYSLADPTVADPFPASGSVRR